MSPPPPDADPFPDFAEVSDPARLPAAPLASVVLITYCHAPYLAEAVESIAAQVAPFPFEIIIAEDNSPDDTRAVALALQRKYPELVRLVFTEENKGASRNASFAHGLCRGRYIAACEGDDFWIDPHKLARQVMALEGLPQVDIAFTRGYKLHADGSREEGWDYGPAERLVGAEELFGHLGWIAPSASLVWRAHVTRDMPPWVEEAPVGDLFLLMAGSLRGGALYQPVGTVCYRMAHPTSFTVELQEGGRSMRAEYTRSLLDYLERGMAHYGVPRHVFANRLNDYRLDLARLEIAEGRILRGLRTFARIDPSFLVRGAKRRLARLAGRQRTMPAQFSR